METVRVYDGSRWCDKCGTCPVVDLAPDGLNVVIHDPDKPGNGSFTMTVKEYNTLITNGRPILGHSGGDSL